MEGTIKELSEYRLDKSFGNLDLARSLYKDGTYSFALNRAYYAAFDAIRAVNALDDFDSGKHSGVIAHFNQFHVKTGDFDTSFSSVIRRAARQDSWSKRENI